MKTITQIKLIQNTDHNDFEHNLNSQLRNLKDFEIVDIKYQQSVLIDKAYSSALIIYRHK